MTKHFLLLLLYCGLALHAHAQQPALRQFIDAHKEDKGFSFAFLSKDMMQAADELHVDKQDWKKVQQMIGQVGSLSMLAGDSIDNAPALYKEAFQLVEQEDLEIILAVKDGQDNVRIWVKEEENTVSELVLLVGSKDEFVLIHFWGALELKNASDIAKLFDAKQVESLAKTTQETTFDFQISPNPSKGQFNVNCERSGELPAQLSLLDQQGRVVKSINMSGALAQKISVNDVTPGVYWVQVKSASGKVAIKQAVVN